MFSWFILCWIKSYKLFEKYVWKTKWERLTEDILCIYYSKQAQRHRQIIIPLFCQDNLNWNQTEFCPGNDSTKLSVNKRFHL